MKVYWLIFLNIISLLLSTAFCNEMISPGILNIPKMISDQENYLDASEMTQFSVHDISDGHFVSSIKEAGFDSLSVIRRCVVLKNPDLISLDLLQRTGITALDKNNLKKYQILVSNQPLIYSIDFLQTLINHANQINMIQAIADHHGKIEPSGYIELDLNTSYYSFTFLPDDGYDIKDIIVDGISKGPSSVYTLWQISNYHTISATFKEIDYFPILSQSSNGGRITPCCEIVVPEGKDKTFRIQADIGYELTQLNIDNKPVRLTQVYTFQDIHAPHEIQAIFSPVLPPDPQFTASPISGERPLVVAFSNQSLHKTNEWLWDFGDGFQSRLKNPEHTYVEPGNYTVCLSAKGPGGTRSITKKHFITVSDSEIDVTASPSTGNAPLSVSFSIDIPDTTDSLTWDFGDGYTSTELQPTHLYSNAGLYTIMVIITIDELSTTLIKKEWIHVNGRNIQGQVMASDTYEPLNNFFVEIWNSERLIQQTTTNADGYYTHTNLPLSDSFILAVFPPYDSANYYYQYYQASAYPEDANYLSTRDNDLNHIDFVLEKYSDLGIQGCILSDTLPLTNTQVNAYSQKLNFGLHAISDINGCYTMSGLKETDDYRVYVIDMQTGQEYYHVQSDNQMGIPKYSTSQWDLASKVTPSSPVLTQINISANKDKGMISGTVSIENQPVENVWVYAHSSALNTGNGALTDYSGRYTITSLAMVTETDPYSMGYIVSVYSDQTIINHQSIKYTDLVYDSGTFVKTNQTDINFQLITKTSISGMVKNKYSHPIPYVNIVVSSLSTSEQATGTTDMNGSYTIATLEPMNDYIVAAIPILYPIQYYKQQSDAGTAQTVDLSKGNVDNIDFILDEGAVILGNIYIENPNHPAPAGLWVNIWSNDTQTGGDVLTDSKGRYMITGLEFDTNDYIISIRNANYVPAYYQDNQDDNLFNDTVYSSSQSKGVAPGAIHESKDRNLILISGNTICGIILYNGLPLSGVRVEAWSELTGGFGSDVSLSNITNGYNYHISNLPPALYHVQIYPDNFAEQSYNVLIKDETINEVYFIINPLENVISGTIHGLEVGKQIYLSAFAQSINYYKSIQLKGIGEPLQYTISGLKSANDYVVEVYASDYPYQAYDHQTDKLQADRIVVENHVSGIDFSLQSYTATISGYLTFPENASAGDVVWIDAFSQSTASGNGVQIVHQNERTVPYTIKGLTKANDYILNTWSTTYKEQYFDNQLNRIDATYVDTSDDLPDTSVNFVLQYGASISGVVYCNNQPVSAIQVQATSDETNSWGATTSKKDGSYIIEGLSLASDFIVDARKYGAAPFYYNESQTTRSRKLCSLVSTMINHHVNEIDIYLSDFDNMSGTVQNSEGKPLQNIWINAWSKQHQAGFGTYTSEDGSFKLVDLPRAFDYIVSATSHQLLPYISQKKINIASYSKNVYFILQEGFRIYGTIKTVDGIIISNVDVELHSHFNNYYGMIQTDKQGMFQISGLLPGDDYNLAAIPPENASCISFSESGIVIDRDIEKNIVLKKGTGKISGYIYRANGTTPLENVSISLYSQKQMYSAITSSMKNGFYEFVNIPISNDYKIEVSSSLFVDETKTDQLSDSTINFNLSTGMPVSGVVRDDTGAPLSNVRVEVSSDSIQAFEVGFTDQNGNYIIYGLAVYNQNAYLVSDYVVKIFPYDYSQQLKAQKRAGDTVNFICSQRSYNELSGTIVNSSGQAYPADQTIIIRLFNAETDFFIKKCQQMTRVNSYSKD
ncbi:MAG: hypothetical protein OMM_02967 [Candidatus Magnetoglobus multicellularis str. Araruama]|uniref:PKD domain-containing protein n=1 Tax=Candidatus Magnetoglobus multicellularis str. Araruama TaxID=890399 RepID=A0A1V1P7E4_9BACT|nr:MAG: hypothetical protein OMM_02967 [Candidatus Magnetoglobus multicellularis str. Araruama]